MALTVRSSLFALLGAVGLATAAFRPQYRLFGLGVAVIFLFLAATALSRATRIAGSLQSILKRPVGVEIWGAALPDHGDATFEVDSVSAFGAGLLIRLRPPEGSRKLLKVAQPGPAQLQEGRIEIRDARYVSWAGTKLDRGAGGQQPALVLRLIRDHK
jgi:hypothetical protein